MLNTSSVRKVVVAGGGTAGWISAFFMQHCFPEAQVTIIEPSSIGILGAGEGTFLDFHNFLSTFDLDEEDFMNHTSSTYKLGIKFEQWNIPSKKDSYYHWFSDDRSCEIFNYLNFEDDDLNIFLTYLVSEEYKVDSFSRYKLFVEDNYSQAQVKGYIDNNRDKVKYGYHFDAVKIAEYLKKKGIERGIKVIDAKVYTVLSQGDEISALELDNGHKIQGDFYVDATGFRKILSNNIGSTWNSLDKELPVNTAITFTKNYDGNPSLITRSVALSAGWMWIIPTDNRLGCGYVYSDKHITEEEAIKEINNFFDNEKEININNKIKFSAGYNKEVLKGNCLSVGLAGSFLEPLEATSIVHTITQLFNFRSLIFRCSHVIPSKQIKAFNERYCNTVENVKDFILLHYSSKRKDSPFWIDMSKIVENSTVQELLNVFEKRMPREIESYYSYEKYQVSFPSYSYISIAQGMNILSPIIAKKELCDLEQDHILDLSKKYNEILRT